MAPVSQSKIRGAEFPPKIPPPHTGMNDGGLRIYPRTSSSSDNGRWVKPVQLQRDDVLLVPLQLDHDKDLIEAASDGELWKLSYATVPVPDAIRANIAQSLQLQDMGWCVPFAIVHTDSGRAIGTTSYHDILPATRRIEIGYTWLATSWQRTHIGATCSLLMMTHAFEQLHASVVGWRADNQNLPMQRSIERLGATKDGVIRRDRLRPDGSARDTVMYSMTTEEWPHAKARLESRLSSIRQAA